MRKANLILAGLMGGALLQPVLAQSAEPASPHTFTGNVGLYSQYIFRGLTQTNEDPAIQGGFDYSHSSGFYLGAWGSNISWLKENFTTAAGTAGQYSGGGSLELDFYGGFKGSFGKSDFTYDLGLLYYWYPGDVAAGCFIGTQACPDADTTEIYGALGWKWLSAKYSYSLDDTFGFPGADGAWYLDLSAAVPLGESGFTLGLHFGKQKYDGNVPGSTVTYDSFLTYKDYRISLAYDLGKVSKTLAGAEVGIMYTDTSDAKIAGYGAFNQMDATGVGVYPKNIAEDQVTIWFKKTF